MSTNINKIVIVGGGSAGWMTAATLISQFPEKQIVVIESPNVPIIGVGESTVGGIRGWLNLVGISDDDFMKHTDAVYKLAIKFTNFYKKDFGSWYYPFGYPSIDQQEWHIKKSVFPQTPNEDFAISCYPQMAFIQSNTLTRHPCEELSPWNINHSAFHFDAVKFANWLRDYFCKPKGVQHIPSEIIDINVNDQGIEHLILTNSEKISADLYIDCTGFKSLLLEGALKIPFKSYENILPNNRAWATRIPYTDRSKELTLYTECTAIDNGWVWNIPLWSRIGTGYVYSDKFISQEDAKIQFIKFLNLSSDQLDNIEFKDIKIKTGTHEKYWEKNVVAIGLSAAFVEPLESTGLVTVHDWTIALCRTLGRGAVNQWDIDEYNSSCLDEFDYWAQFVAMHYALSHRNDTEYWKYVTEKSFQEHRKYLSNLQSQQLFQQTMYYRRYKKELASDYGIQCLSAGMNYSPIDSYILKKEYSPNHDLKKEFLNLLEKHQVLKKQYADAILNKAISLESFYRTNFIHN
jgi:flavin-dependent dehydrogenase